MRVGMETSNATVIVNIHQVGILWMIVGMKKQRRSHFIDLPVEIMKAGQIDFQHGIAVHHQELIRKPIEYRQRCAGSATWIAIIDACDCKSPVSLRGAVVDDIFGSMVYQNKHIGKTIPLCQNNLTLQQWDPANIHQRLG